MSDGELGVTWKKFSGVEGAEGVLWGQGRARGVQVQVQVQVQGWGLSCFPRRAAAAASDGQIDAVRIV
jgi:hypothetical protein